MKTASSEEIDSYLINECDLGYLLQYLEKRKKPSELFWLPVIDVLRLMPDFDKAIQEIKKDMDIQPQNNIQLLDDLIGSIARQDYVEESRDVARGLRLLKTGPRQWEKINGSIDVIAKKYSPELTRRISKIRLLLFGKLQPSWHSAVEKYVLFGIIDTTPLVFRKSLPEIKTAYDPKTGEIYIETRVYADTDVSVLRNVDWWKKLQRHLPNHTSMDSWDEDTVLKRFLHYILRKRMGLRHKPIYEWLKKRGFNVADYNYASQEMRRFEALLKKSSK